MDPILINLSPYGYSAYAYFTQNIHMTWIYEENNHIAWSLETIALNMKTTASNSHTSGVGLFVLVVGCQALTTYGHRVGFQSP